MKNEEVKKEPAELKEPKDNLGQIIEALGSLSDTKGEEELNSEEKQSLQPFL